MMPSPRRIEVLQIAGSWRILISEGCIGKGLPQKFKTEEEAKAFVEQLDTP